MREPSSLESICPIIAIGFALFVVILILIRLRRVVPRDWAHVVIKRSKALVYSGTITGLEGYTGTTYYHIPRFIPVWGLIVNRVPLRVMEISVEDMVTFAAKNARFMLNASIFVRVNDPLKAAQRWPGRGTESDFKLGVLELIQNAIRNVTTSFQAEDIIEEKEEIANGIERALKDDMAEYGCIITNVGVVDIKDAPESTIISDIARKRESEINAESRKVVAMKDKEARVVEAENRQIAEVRVAEAEEAIGVRIQQKEQSVFAAEQQAKQEAMKVLEIERVRDAEIERDAAIQRAEGHKQATIRVKEGDAEGTKALGRADAEVIHVTGIAEAQVVEAKGLAKAKATEAEALALNRLETSGKEFLELDVKKAIGLAGMDALGRGQIKLISTQPLENVLDLFGASGGAHIGAMVEAAEATNPKVKSILDTILKTVASKLEKVTNAEEES